MSERPKFERIPGSLHEPDSTAPTGPAAGRAREEVPGRAIEREPSRSRFVAWYEFSRGPRTPEQLATARAFFGNDGVVPISEPIAAVAAEVFRQLGSPRRRAADIAIGVTAAFRGATLLSRSARDFAGIPGLDLESRNVAGRP